MGGKKTHYGLAVALCLALCVAFPPGVSAQVAAADPPCLAYAFSTSDNHYFLAQDGAVMFGDNLTVQHNCQRLEVFVNGSYEGGTNGSSIRVPLEAGSFDIVLFAPADNQTWNYSVEVLPDRLGWSFEWEQIQLNRPQYVDQDESTRLQNWAAGITALIIWVLATYVWWNLVNSFVQRNFVEEVA